MSTLRVGRLTAVAATALVSTAFVWQDPAAGQGGAASGCTPLERTAAPFVGPDALAFDPTRPLDDNDNVADAAGSGQIFERVDSPGVTDVASLDATTGAPDPSGAETKGSGGIAMADIDGDALTDVVLQYDKIGTGAATDGFAAALTRFMINDGCGRFTETAKSFTGSGVDAIPVPPNAQGNTAIPYFVDFDGDGWRDIFVTRNRTSNSLLMNRGDTNGNGKVDDYDYENHAASMGVANFNGYSRQAQIGDVDGDGWLDIVIASDQIGNRPNIGRSYHRVYLYRPPAGGVSSTADFVIGRFEDVSGPVADAGVTTQTASAVPSAQGYQRPINTGGGGLVPGFGGSLDAATTNAAVAASSVFGLPPLAGNPAFSPAPTPHRAGRVRVVEPAGARPAREHGGAPPRRVDPPGLPLGQRAPPGDGPPACAHPRDARAPRRRPAPGGDERAQHADPGGGDRAATGPRLAPALRARLTAPPGRSSGGGNEPGPGALRVQAGRRARIRRHRWSNGGSGGRTDISVLVQPRLWGSAETSLGCWAPVRWRVTCVIVTNMASASASKALACATDLVTVRVDDPTDGDRRVAVCGEIDVANAATLEELLVVSCRGGRAAARVVVDLSDVDFIDVAGLRALLAAQRAATRAGVRFCVHAGSSAVDSLFARVDAADLFDELR